MRKREGEPELMIIKHRAVIAFVLILAAAAFFFVYSNSENRLNKEQALRLVLSHAGIDRGQLKKSTVSLEIKEGKRYYKVALLTSDMHYSRYFIDPISGEIVRTVQKGILSYYYS